MSDSFDDRKYIGRTRTPVKYKIYTAWFLVKKDKDGWFSWHHSERGDQDSPERATKYRELNLCPKKKGYEPKLMYLVNGSWLFGRYRGRIHAYQKRNKN